MIRFAYPDESLDVLFSDFHLIRHIKLLQQNIKQSLLPFVARVSSPLLLELLHHAPIEHFHASPELLEPRRQALWVEPLGDAGEDVL